MGVIKDIARKFTMTAGMSSSLLLGLVVLPVNAELPTENYGVLSIEQMPPHAILVNTFSASAIIFNADTQQMLGMVSTGIGANAFEIDRAAGVMHTAETYLSRHTRGKRTDVISTYDLTHLAPVSEIEIPPKHASGSPQRAYTGLLQDGKTNFMLVNNITPAVSISVADLTNGKFLNEIFTAGCGLVYPMPELKFMQLCGDGTAQMIALNRQGQEINRTRSEAFFNLDDPLSEKGVKTESGWLFTTFQGKVFEITLQGDDVRAEHKFDVGDIEASWRMGGMQPLAVQRDKNLLLVLVHIGGEDTHKDAGTEVWYYDVTSGRRVHQLILTNPANTIAVSQDEDPRLYAGSIVGGTIDIYDLAQARHLGAIEDIGLPAIIQTF